MNIHIWQTVALFLTLCRQLNRLPLWFYYDEWEFRCSQSYLVQLWASWLLMFHNFLCWRLTKLNGRRTFLWGKTESFFFDNLDSLERENYHEKFARDLEQIIIIDKQAFPEIEKQTNKHSKPKLSSSLNWIMKMILRVIEVISSKPIQSNRWMNKQLKTITVQIK